MTIHETAHPATPAARPLVGIALVLASGMFTPVMDAFAKYLVAIYPLAEVVWARYFFHFAILLPLVLWRYGLSGLWPAQPAMQILRGGLLVVATALFFAALAELPLADALALVFASPLMVTALSPWLLGETVGIRRWSAVIVGFGGALVILQPGFGVFQWGAVYAVGSGIGYAFFLIATRKLAHSAPPLVTLTFTALLGAVVLSGFELTVPGAWLTPSVPHLAMMVAMGVIAAVAHFMLIKAYDHAEASLLAPFGFAEIIMATIVGLVVFGDFPGAVIWLGIAIVITSGVYVAIRERQVQRRPSHD